MLTTDQLAHLSARIPTDPDLSALLATVQARSAPVIAALPHVPRVKALLSRDGGFCPNDASTLIFDPWSPDIHRCPKCGESFSGDRHYRNWARAQHLWLAERLVDVALVAALTDDASAIARADQLLAIYEELYFELPNRDNVLGPSHLFFSTYLESLWINSYLTAACHMREAGLLSDEREAGVDRVAEEAAGIIAEFNEGLSNRQTWHAAALTAIAVWFDDVDLAREAVETPYGLVGHLAEGFGDDGLWFEGENYHLFALRGLMNGMQWARVIGYDLLEDPVVREHFRGTLLAPTRSALPDFTYPARRDSRYGVSLAQPASLDLWEIGRAWLGSDAEIDSWLGALYAIPLPLPPADHADFWLHDAGRPAQLTRSRGDLSAWALLSMQPAPGTAMAWTPASVLLESQGLAVLRHPGSYVSLECGAAIGGHGHPDRLHLTLHAGGVHWLPDQGTASYVHPSLAWYRSELAHNAPIIDGANTGDADARCEAFAVEADLAWCQGRAGEVRRTIVASATHLLDIVEFDGAAERSFELPWHFQGQFAMSSAGHWEPAALDHPFVSGAERFVPEAGGDFAVTLRSTSQNANLRVHLLAPGAECIRAMAPGLPTDPAPRPFLMLRGHGSVVRWASVLDTADPNSADVVTAVESVDGQIKITTPAGLIEYERTPAGLRVSRQGAETLLTGLRPTRQRGPRGPRGLPNAEPLPGPRTYAMRIASTPALDGTLDGFDRSASIDMNTEQNYRRSEEPYDEDRFAAKAWINWDGEAVYLAVTVRKPELVFRAADAPLMLLDNEDEDINSDGLQVYWTGGNREAGSGNREAGGEIRGLMVIPAEGGTLRTRSLSSGNDASGLITGHWKPTNQGYRITLRIDDPGFRKLIAGASIGFDLLINEMQTGRIRRAGQLSWSSGGAWIYLRGDRHDEERMGTVVLE